MTSSLAATPLLPWHRSAGATLAPFAGYEMPIQYGSIVEEHQACRNAATLFDVSHMGRLRFDGTDAAALLDHLLTRRVSDLKEGQIRYSLMCNEEGGILDDVLVSNLTTPSGLNYHLLVVNASNREKIVKWITPHLADFPSVTMTDRTDLTAMIAIQGPRAMEICGNLFKSDPSRLKYYRGTITEQFSKPAIVTRTGYTGEDGIEIIVRAEEAMRIWENLILAGRKHGLIAAGLGARDTLRLEAGMPLYGHELNEQIDPLTAGLKFACNLEGRSFIGDEALRTIAQQGPTRTRVGLLPEGRRPVREGCDILSNEGAVIGSVTSGAPSPTLGKPIAMGYVDNAFAAVDSSLQIDNRGRTQAATITSLPFYKRER
ncbi:Glycine cleavage system T protein [Roseimaritima multifibrata]|uniref:Aminomethyltransferase n=1 Tax=Roseimaritima multifibrata TaxID=1930274 RepID=A0A517MN11_9BACT|nr:glycine cleavage system aminomethyltransferase GcvT [Roseimaritima multifibrata]QDS96273.1 Glycine cleavage system T protein [Roseimaritima multifibrata]